MYHIVQRIYLIERVRVDGSLGSHAGWRSTPLMRRMGNKQLFMAVRIAPPCLLPNKLLLLPPYLRGFRKRATALFWCFGNLDRLEMLKHFKNSMRLFSQIATCDYQVEVISCAASYYAYQKTKFLCHLLGGFFLLLFF